MNPRLIDVHTHTQFAAYEKDSREVIVRALESGVWIINVGTQVNTSIRAIDVARDYKEGVYAAIGLHPIHTDKSYHDEKELGGPPTGGFTSRGEEFDYEYYKKVGQHSKVVAIGECGLDYYRSSQETKKKQFAAFEAQIKLSHELQKPLMIHCRQAFPDLIKLLTNNYKLLTNLPGVVHFFSGTKNDAKALMELGFSFSFGGVTTFARDYDEVIKYIGLDRIVLETDAPYVAPTPHRGKRNEPTYIVYVAEKLAEILGVATDTVAKMTTANARRIFKI
ncbi:MAG: TatD family hydrolase [Candidatus Colwellbacteria bacterium]|nr:TatD family hydrolase [Candidatus Colwellbacteria bacterium]